MIEYKNDNWYFNGKNINECNQEELKAGYREFYKGKTKEELKVSLGLALEVENYLKCQVIKEIWGETYIEPVPAEETIIGYIDKYFQ